MAPPEEITGKFDVVVRGNTPILAASADPGYVAAGLVVTPDVVDSQLAGLLQSVLTAPVQSYVVWAHALVAQKRKQISIKIFNKKNLISNYINGRQTVFSY